MTLFSSLCFFFFESVRGFVRNGGARLWLTESCLLSLLLVLVWRGRGSGRSDNPVMDYYGEECRAFPLAAVHRFYPEYSIS